MLTLPGKASTKYTYQFFLNFLGCKFNQSFIKKLTNFISLMAGVHKELYLLKQTSFKYL